HPRRGGGGARARRDLARARPGRRLMADLDADALRRWLVAHVDGLPDGPVAVEELSGGRSNVTLAVTVGDREVVVRMPPPTAFLPTANDVGREHRFSIGRASCID